MRPEEDVSSPVGAGGVRGFSLLKLSRLGFCATTGEGRGALDPLVSRRPPVPGAEGGSRGEGGAVGIKVHVHKYTHALLNSYVFISEFILYVITIQS